MVSVPRTAAECRSGPGRPRVTSCDRFRSRNRCLRCGLRSSPRDESGLTVCLSGHPKIVVVPAEVSNPPPQYALWPPARPVIDTSYTDFPSMTSVIGRFNVDFTITSV